MLTGKPKTIIHPPPHSRTNRRRCGTYSSAIFIHVCRNYLYVRFVYASAFTKKKEKKYKVARATKEEKLGLKFFGRGEVHISPYP